MDKYKHSGKPGRLKGRGKLCQAILAAAANFRRWRRNPQIVMAFCLAFILCFLLSDKVIRFSERHDTLLQLAEPFIWTFGDAVSVLVISLILLLAFSDMPNLGNEVPFFLIRMNRRIWMLGQILYLLSATMIFMVFILVSTWILTGSRAYLANLWSETAAILGYSKIGSELYIPSFVKVMELSFPYESMLHIFGLMLGYGVLMASLILYLNLWKDNGGVIGGIVFSGFGIVLNPSLIADWFGISMERMKVANILFGWISPLNHATYYMHNFGYDNLPRLWTSYVFFGVGSMIVFILSMIRIKKYAFQFTGTGKG